MRRRTSLLGLALALALTAAATACSSDAPATTSTTVPATTSTTVADAALDAVLLTTADLPDDFTASASVDDTITEFCATEDATAGLQASARGVRGFKRTGGGASVIQLAFRFSDDGASRFVAQAAAALDRCSGVPDAKGLAFDYDPLSQPLEAHIATTGDERVGRHGVSVGSESLTVDILVTRRADIGELVAVLGLDLPRADLDALAATTFDAAIARLQA